MKQFNKRTKPDYELKAKVIADGYDKIVKQVSLASWWYNEVQTPGELPPDYIKYTEQECRQMSELIESEPIWREAAKVNYAYYKRLQRLKHRIQYMLTSGDCIFLTFTFRDDVLSSTSEQTRKRYVTRALKEISEDYIANIDYGKINEREHYHAVVRSQKVDHTAWKYGAINFERIKGDNTDCTRVAKYVAKLTNHAIKNTTKANYIIYSRTTIQ